MSLLSHEEIERNFSDLNPPLTRAEAILESNRCLYCYDAPCTRACPTHIDVPAFIKKIASDNLDGSARVIFDANPIGGTCARVCPVEALCEGACVEKTLVNKPIEIGRLQRYATDHVIRSGRRIFKPGTPNGRSAGIIGSGPAGLSCATYLARLGYDVTVYERRELAGGLDTYGMAEYKMTQRNSLDEVMMVQDLGVSFMLNTSVVPGEGETRGIFPTVSIAALRERHDAIVIAVGLGKTNSLGIPGEETGGVIEALHFIERVKTRNWRNVPLAHSVAVIGAGNTAIDAVTQARRLGAERVMLIYRRTEREAPAYDYEIELARKDGVEFIWQTAPVEIISSGGRVIALRCVRVDGAEIEIPCDMVIKATGQSKQSSFFSQLGLATDEKGRVVVNEMMQTSDPQIFAAGDCVNGGAEAVDASQTGKLAAHGIHLSLTGESVRFAGHT